MAAIRSHLVIMAGPNGAGKTTTATSLLKDLLGITEFVNADLIAQGLSAFQSEAVAFQAGRIMLQRLRQLAEKHSNFAFETTLATRSYASWLSDLRMHSYAVYLIFLWLPDPAMAIARVAERVRLSGHNVPEMVVRRRYDRGIRNFFKLYQTIVDQWWFYDNSYPESPIRIASGKLGTEADIVDQQTWNNLVGQYR